MNCEEKCNETNRCFLHNKTSFNLIHIWTMNKKKTNQLLVFSQYDRIAWSHFLFLGKVEWIGKFNSHRTLSLHNRNTQKWTLKISNRTNIRQKKCTQYTRNVVHSRRITKLKDKRNIGKRWALLLRRILVPIFSHWFSHLISFPLLTTPTTTSTNKAHFIHILDVSPFIR